MHCPERGGLLRCAWTARPAQVSAQRRSRVHSPRLRESRDRGVRAAGRSIEPGCRVDVLPPSELQFPHGNFAERSGVRPQVRSTCS